VYNIELVRQICCDITKAKDDPIKEQDLLSLLHAVIQENQEEVRVRMAFITQRYAPVISDSKAAD
jgi:hypothetical protein